MSDKIQSEMTHGEATKPNGWRPVAEARPDDRWHLVKGPDDDLPYPAMLTDDGWIDAGGDQYRYVKPTEYYVIPDAPEPNRHVAEIESKQEKMISEALALLNDGETAEALKVFRRHFGLVNRWVCLSCGHVSNSVSSAGCAACGSRDVVVRVVRVASRTMEAVAAEAAAEGGEKA